MANKQKSGKVTIANVIAIVGLVLLFVFSFIGHSYMSGGELGWDIIISASITFLTAFLLWFMIKAKGAENELDKWRKLEYATLVVYIAIAIPASIFGGIMHFFVVNDKKEEIKTCAEHDLGKIDQMFNEYRDFEEKAISQTRIGLDAVFSTNDIRSSELNTFLNKHNISNATSVESFEKLQRQSLLGTGFNAFYDEFEKEINNVRDIIGGWAVIQIPSQAKAIDDLAQHAESQLTELSQKANLPIIVNNEIEEENQSKEFKVNGGIESFEFKKAITETEGFSITAILVVLLIHLLILFNYIVARRTHVLGISKHREEDGGIILR